jgi:hypothetical protein
MRYVLAGAATTAGDALGLKPDIDRNETKLVLFCFKKNRDR